MPTQAPPPPQNYAPISQFFGSFLLGAWTWYGAPYNGWFWVGNGPVGWVGDPWTGYTQVAKPATPALPPTQTAPPPAPPKPVTGPPEEVPPPPPEEGCGQPASYSAAVLKDKLGHDGDDGFRSPVISNMFSLPVHTQATWGEDPNPNAYVSYLTHPKIVKDEQGRLRVIHSGRASGAVVFAPPELFDYHAYGSDALFNSRWPLRISQSSFLVMSGHLVSGTGAASSARQLLAFGLAHPTSAKPKLGWYFDLAVTPDDTNAGNLTLTPTKVDATDISDPTDYPTLDIKADARVRGKLTVDGIIDPTGLVLTEQASTPWVAVAGYGALYVKNTAPSTLIFVDDTGAETTLGSGGSGLGDPGGNGIVVRTALNTTTNRTLTGSGLATVSNGDGVGGNPTVTVPAASTTEQLTGTDATKAATPDSVAALWEQGSDIASANTISVGEGGYFNVTGTTDISDIDFATDKAGRKVWLKFTDSVEIAHNASTLILPTGANITTAAGDTACFISEGSDAVRCVAYQRADGSSLAGGGSGLTHQQVMARGVFGGPF